jgi:hypothetical protein
VGEALHHQSHEALGPEPVDDCGPELGEGVVEDLLQESGRECILRILRRLVFFCQGMNLLSGCASGTNLVVTSFHATGPPTVNATNSVELPVEVVVANVGTADATTSKV